MRDEVVRRQLEQVLASALFARSERLSRFLRFAVEQTLAGHADSLKEYTLGLEVFDKDSSFDPRADPIVRVQARRLRAALTEYYATEGVQDPVRIEFPLGGYVARFEERALNAAPAARRSRMALSLMAAGMLLALLGYSSMENRPVPTREISSIAVLPFTDLSPEMDQAYFCDGLADEIIDALTKIEELRVTARTSSFQFRDQRNDISRIGARLGVEALLEGSVRKSGDRLRITARLIRVADGSHLWSQTFERQMTDVFAIQSEIAQAVSSTLHLRAPEPSAGHVDVDAYNHYLLGRFFFHKWTVASVERSVGYFEQAIAKDPNYAPAYAGLANAYGVLGQFGAMGTREANAKKDVPLSHALRLDPNLAEAHEALAMRKAYFEWDWDGADREFRRVFELNPGWAYGRRSYAAVLALQGRFDEAEAEARKAVDLDPLSIHIRFTRCNLAYFSRQYDRAIERCEGALELDPAFHRAHLNVAAAHTEKGEHSRAIALLEAAHNSLPHDPWTLAYLGYANARGGNRDEAQAILQDMQRLSEQRHVASIFLAEVYAGLGDNERALESLERAMESRDGRLVQLKVHPHWDRLRSEPRFQALLTQLDFAQ